MGFIEQWIDKRRQKELARVNAQLEELKRHGPDFVKKGGGSPMVMARGSSRFLPVILVIFLIILIAVVVYSATRLSSLKESVAQKDNTIALLQRDLMNATTELDTLQNRLNTTQSTESELNKEYNQLQSEFALLEMRFESLNNTIIQRDTQIADLQKKLQEKEDLLDEVENCIENESITNKETCI